MVNVAEPPVPSNLDTEHSNLHVLSDDTAEGMNIIVLGAAITACEAKWEAALQLFGDLAAGDEFSRFAAIILLDGFGLFPIYCTYLSISVYTLNSVNSYTHNFSPTVRTKHLTVNELGAGGQDGTKMYPEQPDQPVGPTLSLWHPSRCWISYSGDQCQFAECPGTRQSMGTRLGHHSSGKWLWLEFIHQDILCILMS